MFGLSPTEEAAVTAGPKRLSLALAILHYMWDLEGGTTCTDCLSAMGVSYQSGSVRFYELAKAGCLQATGETRRTVEGGRAKVYQATKKPDFKAYLRPRKEAPKDTTEDQEVLRQGLRFVKRWRKAKTQRGKEQAATDLIKSLAEVADR